MSVTRPDPLTNDAEGALPVRIVTKDAPLDGAEAAWADANDFTGKAGQVLLLPGADGAVAAALLGVGEVFDPISARALPGRLPAGLWRLEGLEAKDAASAALAFALGTYRFDRYKTRPSTPARLAVGPEVDIAATLRIAAACALAREMVDTPAADMGPLQIETIAREIAEASGAALTVTAGDALLDENYPAVHAVGRAAAPHRAPRMIEISWGEAGRPLVALVGKGVVFDTGGLDIKPSAGMRNMKKDMGGAAHVLALARMVMASRLPVRLSVLIPAVENAISGDAMRPGDVLDSRKGLTIEVGNTDAEGRLILADALTRAEELEPALTLDLATLTGAARAALGPQLPPYYTDDEELAGQIEAAMAAVSDPMWRMPLWKGYVDSLDSDVADIKNDPDGWAQAGSVTAALFLQKFAPKGPWAHFDIFAWNPRGRPGWPSGGEVQAVRALYRMIQDRFA